MKLHKSRQFGTLLFYEFRKILMLRSTQILLVVLTIYLIMQVLSQIGQMDDFDIKTRPLQHSIDGRQIDDALIAETVEAAYKLGQPYECFNETNCTYMGLTGWLRQAVDYGKPLTEYDAELVYQERENAICEKMNLMNLSSGEKEYWEKQEDTVSKPFIWNYTNEIEGLYHIMVAVPIVMLFVTVLLLSQIFAGEVKDKTDPLIRCAIRGWRDTYWAKIVAATILTFFLNMILMIAAISTYCIRWGMAGWDAVIQDLFPLTPYSMTIGQFIVWQLIISMATSMLLTAVTCFLSAWFKNSLAAAGAVFGCFLVLFVSSGQLSYSNRLLSQLSCLLSPVNMISEPALYEYRLIGWNGFYLTALQTAPILYITLSVVFILSGYFIYQKRH